MKDDEEDFGEALERESHVHEVNNEITLYHNTGDARFFWRAFLLIHESGEPMPQNFLDKLAQWGNRVIQAKTPQEIATAIEMTGDDKKHIGPKHSEAYRRRWRLASEVQIVKRLYKIKLIKAIETVAKIEV